MDIVVQRRDDKMIFGLVAVPAPDVMEGRGGGGLVDNWSCIRTPYNPTRQQGKIDPMSPEGAGLSTNRPRMTAALVPVATCNVRR